MTHPQVSVVIPTYNRYAMVREAIASVLAQREVDLELIVVDDGSTDDTPAMLDDLRRHDSRVTATHLEHRGPAAARNLGVSLARAPWLAFLDSDDLWASDKLARQIDFMQRNPHYAIAQCQETWIRNGRRVNPGARHLKQAGDIFVASLRTCLVSPSAVIMSKNLFSELGGFDGTMAAAEDYDLWLRVLVDHEIGLLDEQLVTRRAGHSDQLSAMPAIDRFRILALMKLVASERLPSDKRIATSEVLVEKCRIYGGGLRRRGHPDVAAFYDRVGTQASQIWCTQNDGHTMDAVREMRELLIHGCAEQKYRVG